MKSSARDKTEGKMHTVKGKTKEIVGKVLSDSELEVDGKAENAAGKVQEKSGNVKKLLGQ